MHDKGLIARARRAALRRALGAEAYERLLDCAEMHAKIKAYGSDYGELRAKVEGRLAAAMTRRWQALRWGRHAPESKFTL